jgi:hypothetical protein
MTAKQRYRQNVKARSALSRVLEIVSHNLASGIKPDKKTALLAQNVGGLLQLVVSAAGLGPAPPGDPDVSLVLAVKEARKEESKKRKARRFREIADRRRAAKPGL